MLRNRNTEIRMMVTRNTKRGITMSNDWNDYFFWKPAAMETINYVYKIPREIPRIHSYGYAHWVGNFESDDRLSEDGWCIITYTRSVSSPYMVEVSLLQEECEKLIYKFGDNVIHIENAQEKLKSIFKKVRVENENIIERCEKENKVLRADIELRLKRVEELRTLILQGN